MRFEVSAVSAVQTSESCYEAESLSPVKNTVAGIYKPEVPTKHQASEMHGIVCISLVGGGGQLFDAS